MLCYSDISNFKRLKPMDLTLSSVCCVHSLQVVFGPVNAAACGGNLDKKMFFHVLFVSLFKHDSSLLHRSMETGPRSSTLLTGVQQVPECNVFKT